MFGWVSLVFGLWAIITTWWIWYAAPIGAIAAPIIQIVLFGGTFMIYHYVSKRARPALANMTLITGFIAAEFLYLTGQISFPWIILGNGFANDVWAVQWYEFTGVFGGSLWVLASNLIIYKVIKTPSSKWLSYCAACVLAPVILSLIMYWSYRDHSDGEVIVTVVQPNIEPYTEKFVVPQPIQDTLMLTLSAEAPAGVDYIVLPETAIDDMIWEDRMLSSASVRRYVEFVHTAYPETQLITGATTHRRYFYEEDKTETARTMGNLWYDAYNSAIAIDSTFNISVHHKKKLVIGAETMPYMNILKPLKSLIVDLGGTTGQLGSDTLTIVFAHPMANGAVAYSAAPICYESVYGEHFSSFVERGAQLMFIITNDGWWHDTPGYRQHFSFARLRAIENRRYIARSANTGISGFIDARGNVLGTLGWNIRGTITDNVPLLDKVTFYSKYGDYIGRACSYVFILCLLYYIAYRFRKRSHLVE